MRPDALTVSDTRCAEAVNLSVEDLLNFYGMNYLAFIRRDPETIDVPCEVVEPKRLTS